MHKILITKRFEPYDILETLKKYCEMTDFTFDGFSKNETKQKFIKELKSDKTFGLYMKNVNKFYLFKGDNNIDEMLGLNPEDYYTTDDLEEPFNMIDLGKAEAGFITNSTKL